MVLETNESAMFKRISNQNYDNSPGCQLRPLPWHSIPKCCRDYSSKSKCSRMLSLAFGCRIKEKKNGSLYGCKIKLRKMPNKHASFALNKQSVAVVVAAPAMIAAAVTYLPKIISFRAKKNSSPCVRVMRIGRLVFIQPERKE